LVKHLSNQGGSSMLIDV
jgi:hypothetical protein